MENVKSIEAITPRAFGKLLEINTETLRNYALTLESAGYLFAKSEGGHRRYMQQDFAVFSYFTNLIGQGLSLEAAAKVAVERVKSSQQSQTILQPKDDNRSEPGTDLALTGDVSAQMLREQLAMVPEVVELLQQINQGIEQRINEAVSAALQQQAAAFANQNKFDRLAERQIEKTLRQEALQQWGKNPVMVGRIFKREDEAAKANFVQEYIDENFEERYRQRFGLDEIEA